MSTGTLNEAQVYRREVIKEALFCNAYGVMLSHNHPSGVPAPSESDIIMTNDLAKWLDASDIQMIDHIVVAGNDAISMTDNGYINPDAITMGTSKAASSLSDAQKPFAAEAKPSVRGQLAMIKSRRSSVTAMNPPQMNGHNRRGR
jgi:hypothetical protein